MPLVQQAYWSYNLYKLFKYNSRRLDTGSESKL